MAGELIAKLFVPGRPRTKGSLKPMHTPGRGGRKCRVGLTEDHALSTPWKNTMVKALRLEQARMSGLRRPVAIAYAEAVEVHAFYRFERQLQGGALALTGDDAPVWQSHDTPWPTAMDIGDEDKLRRNVLDALTQSGLIADDRLVIGGSNWKRWCELGEQSGVQIIVLAEPDVAKVRLAERMMLEMLG